MPNRGRCIHACLCAVRYVHSRLEGTRETATIGNSASLFVCTHAERLLSVNGGSTLACPRGVRRCSPASRAALRRVWGLALTLAALRLSGGSAGVERGSRPGPFADTMGPWSIRPSRVVASRTQPRIGVLRWIDCPGPMRPRRSIRRIWSSWGQRRTCSGRTRRTRRAWSAPTTATWPRVTERAPHGARSGSATIGCSGVTRCRPTAGSPCPARSRRAGVRRGRLSVDPIVA